MSLTITTPAGKKPLSLDEVVQHTRVTNTDDDSYLLALIAAATEHVESFLKRALINRTYQLTLDDGFPGWFELPKPPLVSVSSITYIDADGDSQTLPTSVYTVDANAEHGRIVLAYEKSWPSTRDIINNVTVNFIAGYGEDTDDVPMPVKQAMLLLIDHWFEHRSAVSELRLQETPLAVTNLLWPYRVNIV